MAPWSCRWHGRSGLSIGACANLGIVGAPKIYLPSVFRAQKVAFAEVDSLEQVAYPDLESESSPA